MLFMVIPRSDVKRYRLKMDARFLDNMHTIMPSDIR